MNYLQLIERLKPFGASTRDLCRISLGVEPEQIRRQVILSPRWEPYQLPGLGAASQRSSERRSVRVWDIDSQAGMLTYIKTPAGAPFVLDAVLGLGVTSCQDLVLVGSAGSIDEAIGIGDVVIPEFTFSADGASRYLAADSLSGGGNLFGERTAPHPSALSAMIRAAAPVCAANRVRWHIGRSISIDACLAGLAHIDEMRTMGANVFDMESAVVFRSATMADIAVIALFSVSDSPLSGKFLRFGQDEAEQVYRRRIREDAIPRIIIDYCMARRETYSRSSGG